MKPVPKVAFSTSRASTKTWHQRLGHLHQLLHSMFSKFLLHVTDKQSVFVCDSCLVGKSSKLSLPLSDYVSSHVLDLIVCDVWGPAHVPSFDGHYFLLCVDHYSKFMWYFPLKLKLDVFVIFQQFIKMAERQFNTKVKSVQTDWGGEFRKLSPFLSQHGIIHRLSCPHTSEQNGSLNAVTECCRNRSHLASPFSCSTEILAFRFWHGCLPHQQDAIVVKLQYLTI
ncbi:hypothetical protein E3N88_08270 [Mikania micrantha]|uniref:Integrase catalytic domain-containing protein n=1 Tax=Mikania micrantha TaxID=192012 RepID=A0A5N6PIU6_9ASTR|nr:hypothetical protein E3N88_08270 [Mikania micrantha]